MAAETAIQKVTPDTIDASAEPARSAWTYRPAVDVIDADDEIHLMIDLPGADPASLDVSVEAGVLTVAAPVALRAPASARCLAREYGVGDFHRRFAIDDTIDPDAVTAEYRDGTLTVRLAKVPSARRRRVPVT